jgi:hypothetical protein
MVRRTTKMLKKLNKSGIKFDGKKKKFFISSKRKPISEMDCFNYGELGHLAHQCPKPQKNKYKNKYKGKKGDSSDEKDEKKKKKSSWEAAATNTNNWAHLISSGSVKTFASRTSYPRTHALVHTCRVQPQSFCFHYLGRRIVDRIGPGRRLNLN